VVLEVDGSRREVPFDAVVSGRVQIELNRKEA
jgi:hypothetical protein